ncbi:MAG TPA: PBP1A family penicillin-binding protein [Gemmatimonadaceae bacterium]|nr:PBP1A family penicillin-binding protein [Gemmatimonadaceae bacterium]
MFTTHSRSRAVLALVAAATWLPLHAGRAQNSTQAARTLPAGTGEAWQIVQPAQSSLVYARDGSLIGEIGRQWRTSVALRALPRYLPQAFISVEDQRFYQHDGVDLIGVAAAIKDNLLGDRRGASTITQQLVGNMHPDLIDRSQRSGVDALTRKLREQAAAREMEKHYTKDQILEAYLNEVDLGHGWFGVEAASRHYFGKPAAHLTLAEAATLAALPKSPPGYDPVRHPARAKARRDLVLTLMAAQGYISRDVASRAKREPVIVVPDAGMSAPAHYFVDAVRREAQRAGLAVMNGGYRIYTSLDPALQREAQTALVQGTARVEARPGYQHPTYRSVGRGRPVYLQGAVIAMDPATGDVRALVGGRDYFASPFDRVFAQRQPGSAIKPIVYAAAIADGIPANAIVADTALSIPLPDGSTYQPGNADGQFLGPMTVHEALVKSRNPVAVQLGERVGMDSVAALALRLGIQSPLAPYPSSAIGASVLRPIELVTAYTAFANLGSVVQPRLITRVEDLTGHIIYSLPPSAPVPVLDPRVAFIVRGMMQDVADRGTGVAARQAVPASIPVAGKTGTTNDNADVWFVGLTPDLVAGVWLGFDSPETIASGAAGGSLAAPIWGQMMARYYAASGHRSPVSGVRWDAPPAGMLYAELDRDTGAMADSTTPPERRYVEYFLDGTEPDPLKVDPWRLPQFGPLVFY